MTFTHEQLLKAVRKAGRNGEPFTCAAVRDCLGLSTRDRKQLNRFYSDFRALQKAAPEVFEKVGKNAYQLKVEKSEPEISELPEPVETERMVCIEIEIEPEPAAEPIAADSSVQTATLPEPEELGFAETAPELESLEMPLQLIEVDFDVNQLEVAPVNETQRVEELIRKDAPPPPAPRGWLGRSQWLGRRVAEFFGRS
ncbi:MAG TPA: hypothetical protein VJV78_36555 [Polyangiales bacterium]|nr:hypothetical protein [Polyangiales bacterium]